MTFCELERNKATAYICPMIKNDSPEVTVLKRSVEKRFGNRVATSADFDLLSDSVLKCVGEGLSASTLKRLWGYVNLNPKPRLSTLDILSRYLGFMDFNAFCEDLVKSNTISSGFFNSVAINSADLKEGARIQVGWLPNRVVTLLYHGSNNYEVVESVNSKLMVGDMVELESIVVGYPLYIPRILRNGEYTPAFVAGRNEGISTLKEV